MATRYDESVEDREVDEDLDFEDLLGDLDLGDDDEDDDEFEDYDLDDDERQGDDDDGEKEDPRYKKLLEQAKSEAEQAVIDAIANEDTNSEVYKGLQRHLAKRDKIIQQQTEALNYLYNYLQQDAQMGQQSSMKVDTLFSAIEEMLDEDGKKELHRRYEKTQEDQKKHWLEQQVQNLQQRLDGNNQQQSQDNQSNDESLNQYRGQVMNQLRDMVKKAGYDPDDDNIDYGNDDEAILQRMQKVTNSLDKAKPTKKQKQRKPANTRTNPSGSGKNGNTFSGRDLLSRGAQKRTQQIRKLSRGR